MRTQWGIVTAAALILATLLLPQDSATHVTAPSIVGLWFDTPTVRFTAPENTTTKVSSACGFLVNNPPAGTPRTCHLTQSPSNRFGARTVQTIAPTGFRVVGDLALTIWLSANSTLPWDGFAVQLMKGQAVFAEFRTATAPRDVNGNTVTTLGTSPTRFLLGGVVRTSDNVYAPADTITLQVTVFAEAVQGTASDVRIHYGSVQHPSGITFGISGSLPEWSVSPKAGFLVLANNALSFHYPNATTEASRPSGQSGQTLNSAPEWTWGNVTSSGAFKFRSNAVMNVTIKVGAQNANAKIALAAHLYVNNVKVASGATPTNPEVGQSNVTLRLVLALNTTNVSVPAGANLTLKFQLYASDQTQKFNFLYGSVTRPSGMVFAAEGEIAGGAPPASTSTTGGNATTNETMLPSPGPGNATTNLTSPTTSPTDGGGRLRTIGGPQRSVPGLTGILVVSGLAAAAILARRRP